MPTVETIQRLIVEQRGMRETAADVDRLSQSMRNAQTTADGLAVTSETSARRQASAARSYDNLRARVDDAYRAQRQYIRDQQIVERTFSQGAISQREHAEMSALVAQRLRSSTNAANDNAAGVKVAAHEWTNMSRQMQDVVTMAAMGASPIQIFTSQAAQIYDVVSSSKASVGDWGREAVSWLGRVLTPARLAVGGLTALGAAGLFAAASWGSAQREIDRALAGAGRASGVTRGDINGIASSSSSLTGLSISEAREFATTLASTGRVGREELGRLTAMGKEFSVALGVDSTEAAQRLAQAIRDPVKGAQELNQTFGFLDASMLRQIERLGAQGRQAEALKLMFDGMNTSVKEMGVNVGTTTKFWTTIGNVVSNLWTRLGEGASRLTGIGFSEGIEERLRNAQKAYDDARANFERSQDRSYGYGPSSIRIAREDLEKTSAELAKAKKPWDDYWEAVGRAERRRESFATASLIDEFTQESRVVEDLEDKITRLQTSIGKFSISGDPAALGGKSYAQANEALQRLIATRNEFIPQFQRETSAWQLNIQAVTAYSPAAQAELAARRTRLELMTRTDLSKEQKDFLSLAQAALTYRSALEQLNESARERKLSGDQAVQSLQQDIRLIDASVGQQARYRYELQQTQEVERQRQQLRVQNDKDTEFNAGIEKKIADLQRLREEEQKALDFASRRMQGSAFVPQYASAADASKKSIQDLDDKIVTLRGSLRDAGNPDTILTKSGRDASDAARRVGELQQKMAELKLGSDIRFEREQLFRTDGDQQIASRLRSVYGADYVNQMDGVYAAQLRFNDNLKTTRDLLMEGFSGFGSTMRQQMQNGATAFEAFKTAGLNALNRITDKLIDMALQNLVMKAFGGMFGGGGGLLGGLFGGGTNWGTAADLMRPNALQFHTGGDVGGVGGTSRLVNPLWFANAPRYHGGGIAGLKPDEVPAILQRGERVQRRGSWEREAGGGNVVSFGGVTIGSVRSDHDMDRILAGLDELATKTTRALGMGYNNSRELKKVGGGVYQQRTGVGRS